ncbi:hypothetical protein CVT26_011781 [Gymnopilus dilepis]|uniref:Uncharacterized protein n=1 Tax=Gymnopilus dilepis TaxID=231916 RepID=A0A409WUG0_9AGAR|nr:hypothetical protein CVT26_011781 [Gymnopilus dilepis]
MADSRPQTRRGDVSSSSAATSAVANRTTTINNFSWFQGASNVNIHASTLQNIGTISDNVESRQARDEMVTRMNAIQQDILRLQTAADRRETEMRGEIRRERRLRRQEAIERHHHEKIQSWICVVLFLLALIAFLNSLLL